MYHVENRVHRPYQRIKTPDRRIQRNIQFLLIGVILSICFFGVLILYVLHKEGMKNVKKSDYVFMKEKETLGRFIDRIKESGEENTKKIDHESYPLLTLFTSWVDRKDKYIVQNRTVENWISFWPHMQPVIFTNDTKLGGQCRQRGWSAVPLKHTAAEGVPVLRYMYLDTMHHYKSTFYGFSNSDILFNDGLIKTLLTIREFIEVNQIPVLITGRRTNVDYKLPCNASDWMNITRVSKKGELVDHFSADYFITTKYFPWEEMEEVIIGRIRVDNWIIQFSQLKNVTVIDSTPTIVALHQTTEAGNAEGESKQNKFYNIDIVRKVRNITINVNQGQTDCAAYTTDFTGSTKVRLLRKTPQIICKGVASPMSEKRMFHIILMKCVLCYLVLLINN